MLRDHLVCGVAEEGIQCCLLLENTLTLKKPILLLWLKRWHHAMPQFSDRPLPPLVVMLSLRMWLLTKFRHHVNILGTHKNFLQISINRTLPRNLCSVVHVAIVPVLTTLYKNKKTVQGWKTIVIVSTNPISCIMALLA